MKPPASFHQRGIIASAFLIFTTAVPLLRAADNSPIVAKVSDIAAVTVTDNGRAWTLDNGIVKAVINKRNGEMRSLVYKGVDTMGHDQGSSGYWEQDPSAAASINGLTNSITIDPANNGGRARRSLDQGRHRRQQIQLGPGAPGGGTYCDIEIRYALGRGDSGIYVYAIFTHPPSYRAGGVGPESRYITRINQTFDWITVDKDRNMLECAPTDWGTGVVVHAKEQRIMTKGVYKNSVEHKYSYSGVQYKTPAYGWSSTRDHIGIWFINPTIEYLSGGPTKLELDCHFGDNGNPEPDHPRLLGRRPLRHRRACQRRRRRGMDQGRRPHLCLRQLAGSAQAHHPGRTGHAGRHRRQSDGSGKLARQCQRPVAGRLGPGRRRKPRNGPTPGSTAWTIPTGPARERDRTNRAQRPAGAESPLRPAAAPDRRRDASGQRRQLDPRCQVLPVLERRHR